MALMNGEKTSQALYPPSSPPPRVGVRVALEQHPSSKEACALYRMLLKTRLTEERLIALCRAGAISGGYYSGLGNEASSLGVSWRMLDDDVLVPMHRDIGAHLVRGHSLRALFLQYFKKATAQTEGKDAGLHLGTEGSNIVGMISHLAHMLPVAAGIALAERQKKRRALLWQQWVRAQRRLVTFMKRSTSPRCRIFP